jgi:hypothetical protein
MPVSVERLVEANARELHAAGETLLGLAVERDDRIDLGAELLAQRDALGSGAGLGRLPPARRIGHFEGGPGAVVLGRQFDGASGETFGVAGQLVETFVELSVHQDLGHRSSSFLPGVGGRLLPRLASRRNPWGPH